VALAVMHLGIGLFMEVGLFSYVSLAGLALFLPAEFWNSRFVTRFITPTRGPALAGVKSTGKSRPWGYLPQGLCLVALLYVVALNLNSLPGRPLTPLTPEAWRPLARGAGLAQSWGMFDSVPSRDGWYVARARLNDGTDIDLLRQGAPVDWSKPRFPARLYPNYYWQKLFREMAYDDEQGYQLFRVPVAEYLCRAWNKRNPPEKQIADFELVYCTEPDAEANPAMARIQREQLAHLDLSER